MAGKTCFENLKIYKTLIGDNVGKGYDCLYVLFFNFEEALTSFKFKNFD